MLLLLDYCYYYYVIKKYLDFGQTKSFTVTDNLKVICHKLEGDADTGKLSVLSDVAKVEELVLFFGQLLG